ncbi:AraC family transcriptional regulator [Paenibacillus sp. GCM10023252]|uniref:AraC family transcriptional regulator n=1 Tax=Paenibacillus sp. GCM10023252 TaxID=3252649 RepID=UPI00362289D5
MINFTSPVGLENSLEGHMTRDIQLSFQIYAAHWRRVNAYWTYPEHGHPMFEINLVLSGRQQMKVNGVPVSMSEGDLLLLHPGVPHSSDGSCGAGDMEYFCLHFDIDHPPLRRQLIEMTQLLLPFAAKSPTADQLRIALSKLANAAKREQATGHGLPEEQPNKLQSLSDTFLFLAALTEWAAESEGHSLKLPGLGRATEQEVALAAEIERRLQQLILQDGDREERVSMEEIAAQLGYSSAHCNRVFRKVYGISPRQHLSDLIIRTAKLLLMDSSLSIEVIARKLGYRDVSQFSKQFKRWMNISPLGYRRLSHE